MDSNDYNMIKPLQHVGPLTAIDRRNKRRKDQGGSRPNPDARRPQKDESDEAAAARNSAAADAPRIDYQA